MKQYFNCKRRWCLVVLLITLFILGLCLGLYLGNLLKYNETPPLGPDQPLPEETPPLRPLVPAFHPMASNRPLKQPNIVTDPRRTDVELTTPWLAPIVWEGTFDPALLDALYEPRKITVAVTVFAYGKYTRFLKDFLETAERYFLLRTNVRYYVYTDQPDEVPSVELGPGRQLFVRSVQGKGRWQDITAGRMRYIQSLIENELRGHADYIFSFDVDMKFHAHVGTEILGQLVAGIHPGYFTVQRSEYTYERRPASKAYMAPDEGDYYYQANIFGGELAYVHHLVSTCGRNIELDAQRAIEAIWQDESHYNKYLFLYKPTKVLSPEYLWQDWVPLSKYQVMKIKRLSSVIKDYAEVRPN